MMDKKEKLNELKRRHNAVILAHYYAPADVQEAADYIGDSFLLSQTAARLDNPVICFAGVRFMGESAKILCPDKTVLLPEAGADCPMAHMADPEEIAALRERVEDLAVVCYINSTAELKCCADVCVTSSNALKIVRSLPNKNICFIPDRHLGQHIAASLPEKRFFFFDGCCHVHTGITPEQVRAVRKAHPGIPVLAHPECRPEVLELADYIGSTSGIIGRASSCSAEELLICTEQGVLRELRKNCPGKTFYFPGENCVCPDMKQITLDKVIRSLETLSPEVTVSEEIRRKAWPPLARMLVLGGRKESAQ